MAFIRKEVGRHDWREQRFSGGREGLLCWNCRASWDFTLMRRDPPVTGCLSEIAIQKTISLKTGGSRLHDYTEQEMRLRAERERDDLRIDTQVTPSRFTETVVPPEEILAHYRRENARRR